MPESDWQAWVEILPDFSKFGRKVDGEIGDKLESAGTVGAGRFGSSFTRGVFKGSFLSDLALRAIDGVTSAVTSGISYAFDAVDLGSSLGEQVNAVQVQFGDLSDEVLALSERAPKALNLTRKEFDQLAVRFSSFAKTVAGKGGDASKVIGDLTQRGADFASVYDIDVSDALTLFQSGLAGETEPLRRFGIDLSAARVQAYAYKNGIADVGTELTEAQKIQARYGSLLEQTAAVQGDLANTSGSYANQQRRLNVQLEEAKTKFGQAILPTANELLGFANNDLIPILERALDNAGPALSDSIEKSLPKIETAISKIADNLPTLIDFGGTVAQGIADGIAGAADIVNGIDKSGKAADAVFGQPFGIFGDGKGGFDPFSTVSGAKQQWEDAYEEAGRDLSEKYAQGLHSADVWERAANDAEREKLNILARIGDREGGSGSFADAGRALGRHFSEGLAEGIRSGEQKIGLVASAVANIAVKNVKIGFDNRSPSHKMEAEGKNAIDGLIKGWTSRALEPPTLPVLDIPDASAGFSAVRAAAQVGGGAAAFPRELTLVVDGRAMRAYIVEGAQQVVTEYDRADQLTIRAGRS